MELVRASAKDWIKVNNAVCRKHLEFCTPAHISSDFEQERLYVVKEGEKVLASVSVVEEPEFEYTAIKRMCILNKKNYGKGIARFATHEIQKLMHGKIGATPWEDNYTVRHILEAEGFKLEYQFNGHWCFYSKEV